MRLVLHIGAAKTGTTYIQHALYRNSALLRDLGVYLPLAGRFEFATQSVAHHHLAWEIVEPRRFKSSAGGWDALEEELSSVDAPVALVTAEALERLTYSPERRHALEERLARISDEVTVVYVVREQLSHLNSLYTQNIKSLRGVEEFRVFVRQAVKSGRFDLDRCFRPWYRSDQLDLVAVPFDDLIETDPFVALLHQVGIDVPPDKLELSGSRSNESLSPVAIEAAKLLGISLRAVDPAYNHRSAAGQQLYRAASAAARRRGWDESKYWGWTPEFAGRIAQRFTESNDRFSQSVWGEPWPIQPPVARPVNTVNLGDLPTEQLVEVLDHVRELTLAYAQLKAEAADTDSLGLDAGDEAALEDPDEQ
jgi:hypothetical protein